MVGVQYKRIYITGRERAAEQERLRRALVKAGAPDTSFAGIVAAVERVAKGA